MTRAPARVTLRPARATDAARLRAWRNDRATRRWFLDPTPVTSADHEAWFARRLSDPDCRIFIVEAAGRPAGQLRLEKARGAAEVSFSVSPDARGFGIGTEILKRAPRLARRTLNVTTLVAHVMPANVASAVAFLKAGFELTGRRRRRGTDVYEFRLITE